MKILLFGISNIGKTTLGELLGKKLAYPFIDLDQQIKEMANTIDEFQRRFPYPFERHKVIGELLKKVVQSHESIVVAVTPIAYSRYFNYLLDEADILGIELVDQADSILKRLIFADENDVPYQDDEYVKEHHAYYLREIKKDITYYKPIYKKVKHKFDIHGDGIEVASQRLYEYVEHLLATR